jgi:hypothetical protein
MIRIKFTKNQWERVSEISGNGGLLSMGSIILPFILDKPNPFGVLMGMVITSCLWYISLQAARKY